MLLIGQFDSPYVRRVGITLRHYAIPFEHRPWAVFRDAEQIATLNPLRRVPTFVLDDGTVFVEALPCLEVIDEQHAEAPRPGAGHLLLPRKGRERRDGLRLIGFASGVADKAVALIYERVVRDQRSERWIERCRKQVTETLHMLERDFATRGSPFYLGERLSHADIAVDCALTLIRDGLPGWLDMAPYPGLADLQRRCEAMPIFQQTFQMFDAPQE
jgi:glutathione S-transferase